MSKIEDIILLKRELADKAKIYYHKRTEQGRNKQLIPIEQQKRRGRPTKDKIPKMLMTRGRKPDNNISLDNLPKYLLKYK